MNGSTSISAPPDGPAGGGDAVLARRLIAAAIAIAAAAVLAVAVWSSPSDEGLGTHTQLGLPACGWISTMQTPCMTCGMTTSFSYAAEGRLVTSFQTQPFGFLLALTTAGAFLAGTYVAATGANVAGLLSGMIGARFWWAVAGLALAAWIYKIVSYKGL